MPPSVTSATVAPLRNVSTSSGVRRSSFPSKYETTRAVIGMSRSRASRARRRVSSAAITSESASIARSRLEASLEFPRGAPTRINRPGAYISPTASTPSSIFMHATRAAGTSFTNFAAYDHLVIPAATAEAAT